MFTASKCTAVRYHILTTLPSVTTGTMLVLLAVSSTGIIISICQQTFLCCCGDRLFVFFSVSLLFYPLLCLLRNIYAATLQPGHHSIFSRQLSTCMYTAAVKQDHVGQPNQYETPHLIGLEVGGKVLSQWQLSTAF